MSHRAELLLVWSLCCWALQSSAIDVRGDGDVMVENNTTATLNFTFTSYKDVSRLTMVEWSFRSNQPDHKCFSRLCTILVYENRTWFHRLSEFEDRLRFIGDIDRRDVSIQLSPVQLSDRGSYSCSVSNPPDNTGPIAHTQLHVERSAEPSTDPPPTGEFQVILILVPVCVVIIIVISATVLTIYCKRRLC